MDVLVPAAVSYTITADNCDRVRGSLIVEAANVPTTPDAEQRLLERGVTVIPDFIANTGAAAGAWWVILGEVVSPVGACSRLSAQIRPLVAGLMARAEATGRSVRQTAVLFARENSQRMISENGGAVAFRDLYTATQPGRSVTEPEVPVDVPVATPADARATLTGLPVAPSAPSEPDLVREPLGHPLNGSHPEAADVLDGPVDTGFQAPDAVPAYWPGDTGTGTY